MQGVNYCHQHNIIHKDLKPENILVNVNPNSQVTSVKLADFGIACKIETSLYRTKVLSSPGYEASECL